MSAEVLTTREAAEFLRLSVETVKTKARAGEIPVAKVGRACRFQRSVLTEWLSRGGTRYEAIADQGLVAVMLEHEDEPTVPWEQAKAKLGL
jgi:excisionase family DNA binding protein